MILFECHYVRSIRLLDRLDDFNHPDMIGQTVAYNQISNSILAQRTFCSIKAFFRSIDSMAEEEDDQLSIRSRQQLDDSLDSGIQAAKSI